MNREIKFRVWDGVDYMSSPFTLNDLQLKVIQFASNCVVMQFTGLKDKNGEEIYEGDIVDAPGHIGTLEPVVYGHPYNAAFCVWNNLLGVIDDSDIEVMGNIYENPELIKKELV